MFNNYFSAEGFNILKILAHKEKYGRVVQWLERCPDKTEAVGSIPTAPTT